MTEAAKSPIKDRPLRHPGQSLEEERRSVFEDKLEPWLIMALVSILWAALEWYRFVADPRPHPIILSVVALAVLTFTAWRTRRLLPLLRALRQGAEGEKAVGQYLERLRAHGYEVFHDITGPTFNIDHALIGPAGVFTVETKTWSKPPGDARVRFDGDTLLVAGIKPERDPISQALAQANWLRRILRESTGRDFPVHPVVVFPGWYVEQSGSSLRSVWVLEPKALPAFIANEPARLETSDVALARFHVSRFIRSMERERAMQ